MVVQLINEPFKVENFYKTYSFKAKSSGRSSFFIINAQNWFTDIPQVTFFYGFCFCYIRRRFMFGLVTASVV
jgi:hypothetical protein